MAQQVVRLPEQFVSGVSRGLDEVIVDVGDHAPAVGPADDTGIRTHHEFIGIDRLIISHILPLLDFLQGYQCAPSGAIFQK